MNPNKTMLLKLHSKDFHSPTYRAPGENEDNRARRDCLKLFRAKVSGAGVVAEAEFDAIDSEVLALIDAAVEEAKAAPLPGPAELTTDVYVAY